MVKAVQIFDFSWRRALSEFAVIVIGVLTALAVDAWADGRNNVRMEREYLERMRDDLTSNVESLRASQRFYTRVNASAIAASALLADAPLKGDAEAALVVFYQASRGDVPDFFDATYRELVSTGGLRLIRDVQLREALIKAHLKFESLVSGFAAWKDREPYRDRVRRLIPADIQAAIASLCRLNAANSGKCRDIAAPGRAQMVMRRIAADAELRDDLNLWLAAQANIRSAIDGQLKATEAVLTKLRTELQ